MQPPKPAPTLPSTAAVPRAGRLGRTGKPFLLLHYSQGSQSHRERAEGLPGLAALPLEPGLTSDTRCRFLLAMTVRQPCLQGRGR